MMRSTFKMLFYMNGNKEKNGIVPIMGRVATNAPVVQFSYKQTISKVFGIRKTELKKRARRHEASIWLWITSRLKSSNIINACQIEKVHIKYTGSMAVQGVSVPFDSLIFTSQSIFIQFLPPHQSVTGEAFCHPLSYRTVLPAPGPSTRTTADGTAVADGSHDAV